jgi:iron complex outermembrane receptor protein
MSKAATTSTWSRAGLLFGVSLGALVVTTPALAQASQDTATEETVPPGESPAEADAQLEAQSVADVAAEAPAEDNTIVITGSRLRRTEASSASPLQIIDPTLALRQGQVSTAEIIQSSPIASGSSQITSAISTNFITNGGPGSQTISLRGLGAERTLVLLNSKRAGPAGTRGGVTAFDLNVLPSSIIRSVEILKDGASSIYGSDAIAGVVNILTKRDTDGIEFAGSVTAPFESGGEQYDVSATWGKDFGRGHILLSGSYYKQRMLRRQDRDFLGCPEDYIFRPDSDTRADLIDPRTNRPNCINGVTWGHVWTYYAYNVPDYGLGGVLLQPDFGQNLGQYPGIFPIPAATGPGDLTAPPGYWPVSLSGDGPSTAVGNFYHSFEQKASVIPETSRKTFYADGSFELSDNIELYGEFLFNNRKTFTDSLSQIYNYGGLNFGPTPGEPFPGFYNEFGGLPNQDGGFPVRDPDTGEILYFLQYTYLSPTGIFDQYDNTIDVDYYRAVAGIKGEIGGNWRWDIYGQRSRSIGKYTYNQIVEDALYTQWFKYGSCEGDVTAISGRSCIDINWVDPAFLAGELTQEQVDFLLGEETGKTKYKQDFIEGSIAGNLFDLPAGPLGLAVGAVHRKDSINDRPGDITMAPNPFFDPSLAPDDPECTLDSNEPCSEFVDNAYANPVSSGHTRGYQITQEVFGEVNIPVLKGSALGNLELSAAGRLTNVKAVRQPDGLTDKNNGNFTYKLMGNWQVTPWVRLRSTYGTSFRAPALFEQFLAGQVTGARQVNVDPCVRWQENLAEQLITARQAQNCQADQSIFGSPGPIEPNHTGGGIQIKVFNSGGIGQLEPETSRSWTASVILTPRLSFLPDTDLALTVDYFDIKVKGEITTLGAANILRGCYDAEDFPGNPLCTLFRRNQIGDPENLVSVQNSFINVNRQRNKGLDFTLRADHRFGGDTRLSILGNATYQLKDDITLFGGELDDLNGEIGDPKFTADLNVTLDKGPWSFFWGTDYVGKTSNEKEFIADNGGLCNTNANNVLLYGNYCYDVTTEPKFYHSASITRRIADDRYQVTMGIANLFDTTPPRISTAAVFGTIGQIAGLGSQYDLLGRRFFVNVKARFK